MSRAGTELCVGLSDLAAAPFQPARTWLVPRAALGLPGGRGQGDFIKLDFVWLPEQKADLNNMHG